MNFALWSVDSWIVADKMSTLCLETPRHRRLGALLTMKWSCKSIIHSELTREQSIGVHCVIRRRPKRTQRTENPFSNPECPFKAFGCLARNELTDKRNLMKQLVDKCR